MQKKKAWEFLIFVERVRGFLLKFRVSLELWIMQKSYGKEHEWSCNCEMFRLGITHGYRVYESFHIMQAHRSLEYIGREGRKERKGKKLQYEVASLVGKACCGEQG